MAHFKPVYILFYLSLFTAVIKAFDVYHWAYLQKAGDLDTGCLHNLTLDDNVTDQTFTIDEERAFLMDLFDKTDGLNWKNKKNWGDTNTHHCDWTGIQCYPNNTYVKWIDLTYNNLKGTPPNFWKFRNLQGICVSRNTKMTGSLSDIVATNMTRLRRLCVSFGNIHGTIPWDVILQLKNLEKLQICCMVGGHLKGYLPQDLGKLSKLQVLSLGENNIRGELPLSISNLTKLWFLDLEYSKLTKGNLSYLSSMTQLQYLHMINCKLTGGIPKDFGKMHPKLVEVTLFGNELEGELNGDSLLGLKNLQHLSLSGNKLRGLLPRTFSTLHSLHVLDLSHNNFSGLQENMTFSVNLEILNLGGNKYMNSNVTYLIGALQNSTNLRILNASACSLKGEMPSTTWNFEYLTYLDLSHNNLSGRMTASNSYNMLYLFHVSLASNNLSGNVDTMAFFAPLKALAYLDITDNHLLRISLQTYLKPKYEFVHQKQNYSCPSVEITSTRGSIDMDPTTYKYSLCFCNYGFYGYTNQCLSCKHGGLCQKEASSLIVSDKLQKKNHTNEVGMTIKKGYWPCCNGFDDVQRLVKCSEKASLGEEVCSPSGKCRCRLRVTADGKLKTSCNRSCVCRYGNTGQFCSKCITDYYKRGNICVKCTDFWKNFPVVMTVCFVACLIASIVLLACFRAHKRLSLIVIGLLVIALIILHISSIIPGWFFIIMSAVWIVGLSTESQNLQSFICIAVFYFQSLDAMLSEANIWPEAIIIFKYKLTNIFSFEFAQLTCSFSRVSKPEIIFTIMLLLPLSGIVIIWSVCVLSKALGGCVTSSMCKRVTIQVLLLVYFPITAKSFSALSPCAYQDGLSFLKDAPWLDCHGTSYDWLEILGYISLVFFVIGIPLLFWRLLYKGLDTDGEPVLEETGNWLKPLYEEFQEPYRRWFPLIFLARRIFLAIMLSLVPSSSSYQILGITCLLLAFIILVLIKRPYKEYSDKFEFENMADIVISIVLLLSFIGLAFIRNLSHDDNSSLVIFILVINLVIVLFCVGGIIVLFAINLLRKPDDLETQVQYEPIPN